MPFKQEKRSFDEHGFTVVRGLLKRRDFVELQENLERYIAEVVPTLGDGDAFYVDPERPASLKQLMRMGCDPWFREYMRQPQFTALAQGLIGEPVEADEPEWFDKPPGTSSITPPHQDNFYFSLAPANVVTLWMALDEVDTENGCLRYVDGSHQRGFRPHAKSKILGFSQGITDYGTDDFSREVAVRLSPGDVVAHHGMTIHRADANLSTTRHRRSFALVFRGVSCRRDEEAYARYLAAAREQHQELGLDV
jgi:phytanoyl-CoA hydroxylase